MKRSVGLGSLVCMAATTVPALFGNGAVPAKVDLLTGVAWLPNEVSGDLVRVNGETARVDAKTELSDVGAALGEVEVDQNGSTVVVRVGGQMRSLDVADLNWGGEWAPSAGGLVVGDRAAYMVERNGKATALDPATLESRGSVELGAAPAGPSTVANGRLVVPLADGHVKVVAGKRIVADIEAGDAGDRVAVSAVGDQVAILNVSEGELRRLDPATGRVRRPVDVELPAGEMVVPPRLPRGRLWVAASRTGDLVGISLFSGSTKSVNVAPPRSDLVGPAVSDGYVYVVNRTAVTVTTVELRSMTPQTEPIEGVTDASRVQLVAEGGKVFVNDPTSNVAIVFDQDKARPVDKYSDEGVTEPEDKSDAPSGELPNPETPPDANPVPAQPVPPPEPVAPEPPAAVEAQAGNESATVSWTPGAGASPATEFHITYDGLDDPVTVPGDQVSAEVGDLTNGDEYVFEVWASNEVGESARVASNPVVPNDRVPGTPARVTAESRDASALVRWEAADDRGREITGYVVRANPGGATQEVQGTGTEVEFRGLTNGQRYTFTVTAVNDLDAQGEPSAPSAEVMPYGAPGQVPNVTANPRQEGGAVDLSWGEAPDPSGQAHRYSVTVTPRDAGPFNDLQSRSLTVDGLQNGVQYTFTITAINDRGPGTPREARVTPGRAPRVTNGRAESVGGRQMQVTFDVDDGGYPVTECTVSGGGGEARCNGNSATVTVALHDTSYDFTISVANERGGGQGGANGRSGPKTLTVDASAVRWDGATCSWPRNPYHRPLLAQRDTCRGFVGWVPDRGTVNVYCWTTGEQHQDDQEIQSTTYVYARYGGAEGYMSHLYFTSYADRDGTIAGLRQC